MPWEGLLWVVGWHGTTCQTVLVVSETPKRYRIQAITDTRLAGSRQLKQGETALVPKHAITNGPHPQAKAP